MTFNLKDFPEDSLSKYGIEAQHPDDFILQQLTRSNPLVLLAAKQHRASLKNPPKSVDECLTTLENQGLPLAVAALRRFAELI